MLPSDPVVRLRDLEISIDGRTIIPSISLDVANGERLCIVGPPGSGKSLLLEFIAARAVPHRGKLSYPAWIPEYPDAELGVAPRFAVQVVSTTEQRRIVSSYASFHQARWHAAVTQPPTVDLFMSPRATYGIREYEEAPPELEYSAHHERCAELLQRLGIEYLLKRPLSALSNGEWRKLLLARALLARPRLLLLDDPLGGLDPDARTRVIDTLEYCICNEQEFPQLQPGNGKSRRGAMTLVYTTPRPEEFRQLTSRFIELPSPIDPAATRQRIVLAATPQSALGSTERTALANGTPVLRLRDATVRSGQTTLLDHVSLEVTHGQNWLITGPNGAGKSTLLALLLGDHPQSYVVDLEVLGLRAGPGVTLRERQRRVGFMAPELAAHYPNAWSVHDVVLSGINASIGQFTKPSTADKELAHAWLQALGLLAQTHHTLGSLSEAQMRKVFLARALMGTPALLMLDEPTQGLPQDESLELLDFIDSVVEERRLTLIVVSHHALERPRCITHHLALDKGRVIHSARIGVGAHG